MELLGLDIGFGFTKATNGKEFVMFKSILGEAAEIQYRADLGSAAFTSTLHITVGDNSWFVGDYAEKQSAVRQFTLDQDTLISDFVKTLALTAVGLFSEKYVPLNVVSGLPVGYFKDHQEKFSQAILGHHTMTYHKPDGTKVNRRINVNKVRMIPQPMGSVLNMLMNDKGKLVNKDLSRQKLGVIDIGFRTTDFVILDKLQYINRGSRTLDVGVSDCFRQIANRLRDKTGLAIELYRLYEAVSHGSIKVRGEEFQFSGIRDQVYSQIAHAIANEANQLWAEEWDMDAIVLSGGGSMELARDLTPLVHGRVLPIESHVDARLNNVQGYIKYAKHTWGDVATEAQPPSTD